MCLYLGRGWLHTPLYICTPPYVCMPPICSYAPRGVTPPRGPHASVLLHGFGTLHVVGGFVFLFYMYMGHSTPIWGCLPLNHTPHTPLLVLCIVILRDISSYVGLFPSIEGFGGVPPSLGEVWVTHQQLFTCSFCYTFFCSALCLTSQPQL